MLAARAMRASGVPAPHCVTAYRTCTLTVRGPAPRCRCTAGCSRLVATGPLLVAVSPWPPPRCCRCIRYNTQMAWLPNHYGSSCRLQCNLASVAHCCTLVSRHWRHAGGLLCHTGSSSLGRMRGRAVRGVVPISISSHDPYRYNRDTAWCITIHNWPEVLRPRPLVSGVVLLVHG